MRELVERQHACLQKEIEPALRKGGIRRLELDELNAAQRRHVEAVFEDSIYPVVTPMAVAPQISEQNTSGTTSICIRRIKP